MGASTFMLEAMMDSPVDLQSGTTHLVGSWMLRILFMSCDNSTLSELMTAWEGGGLRRKIEEGEDSQVTIIRIIIKIIKLFLLLLLLAYY